MHTCAAMSKFTSTLWSRVIAKWVFKLNVVDAVCLSPFFFTFLPLSGDIELTCNPGPSNFTLFTLNNRSVLAIPCGP